MRCKGLVIGFVVGFASLLLTAGGQAEETKKAEGSQFVFTLPVYLAEELQIRVNTPATKELLERADAGCVDETCKQRVSKCRKDVAHCLLVVPPEAMKENRKEAE
jgi:hypothetical protein